jgi:hypothetical protein
MKKKERSLGCRWIPFDWQLRKDWFYVLWYLVYDWLQQKSLMDDWTEKEKDKGKIEKVKTKSVYLLYIQK